MKPLQKEDINVDNADLRSTSTLYRVVITSNTLAVSLLTVKSSNILPDYVSDTQSYHFWTRYLKNLRASSDKSLAHLAR
jgi:hypothetical protein